MKSAGFVEFGSINRLDGSEGPIETIGMQK